MNTTGATAQPVDEHATLLAELKKLEDSAR
jgi:hypothetical protein